MGRTSFAEAALAGPPCRVNAVDNELYRELVHAPEAEHKHAIEEAERRRRLAQHYTLSDYRRDRQTSQT